MPATQSVPRVTLVTFYRFPGFFRMYLAFSTMGILKFFRPRHPGMRLGKMLGNGSGIGFGLTPDFRQYSVLAVFDNETQAADYYQNSRLLRWLRRISKSEKVLFLRAHRSRGVWDGRDPYPFTIEKEGELIVILTRAKLRLRKVRAFWKKVPAANKSLASVKGRIFSAGMGEWPFSHPITFSMWENEESMIHFAHEGEAHRSAVQAAREGHWFREDLFVRYSVIRSRGFGVNEI